MNTTTLIAPIALAMGLAAAPSLASPHSGIVIGVGVPPVVVDVAGVQVLIGHPAPQPEVVYVRQHAPPPQVVYVHDHARSYAPRRDVVVIHDRDRYQHRDHRDHRGCGSHDRNGHHGKASGHVKHAKHNNHGSKHGGYRR